MWLSGYDLLLVCQSPGCDLQLDHKMLLLSECLHTGKSKKMSLNRHNSEVALFFNFVINGNTMVRLLVVALANLGLLSPHPSFM